MRFDANAFRHVFHTERNKAYFWHGRTTDSSGVIHGGMNNAADIASQRGGKTMEMCMVEHQEELERAGVDFKYNEDGSIEHIEYVGKEGEPATQEEKNQFWEDCSETFAEESSGDRHVIEGNDFRELEDGQMQMEEVYDKSIWNSKEYSAISNSGEGSLTHVDAETGKDTGNKEIFNEKSLDKPEIEGDFAENKPDMKNNTDNYQQMSLFDNDEKNLNDNKNSNDNKKEEHASIPAENDAKSQKSEKEQAYDKADADYKRSCDDNKGCYEDTSKKIDNAPMTKSQKESCHNNNIDGYHAANASAIDKRCDDKNQAAQKEHDNTQGNIDSEYKNKNHYNDINHRDNLENINSDYDQRASDIKAKGGNDEDTKKSLAANESERKSAIDNENNDYNKKKDGIEVDHNNKTKANDDKLKNEKAANNAEKEQAHKDNDAQRDAEKSKLNENSQNNSNDKKNQHNHDEQASADNSQKDKSSGKSSDKEEPKKEEPKKEEPKKEEPKKEEPKKEEPKKEEPKKEEPSKGNNNNYDYGQGM